MSPILGIDLGTTHTVLAVLTEDGPRVIARPGESALIPSAVAIDSTGALLVGEAALARLQHDPDSGVRWFKRDMGSDRTWNLLQHELGPAELSALVLREARAIAEDVLGQPVGRAVITVPAYFQEPQRAATAEAGKLAGLEVVRMINEPTAAALAHGLGDPQTERRVAVLDLGGGTFDVTVLEIFDGIVEVLATGGDSRLGGEDLTDALAAHFKDKVDAPDAALRAACEQAKRALATADVAFLGLPAKERLLVDRRLLDALCQPLLARIGRCIDDALRHADLRPQDIDQVVLAGGATRTPAIRAYIVERLNRDPVDSDPDRIVAMGAAIQSGLITRDQAVSELIVTDVLTHSLGVEFAKQGEDRILSGYFDPVLHRNTTLPARRVQRFYTMHPKQTVIKIRIFQGEHRYTHENRLLGELEVSDIPPCEGDEGAQAVDIAFAHTLDGLLEIEATVVETGKTQRLLVESLAGRLTPARREAALKALEALRVHPKELLPNRLLLERALARFERLSAEAKRLLDGPLSTFEDALERQHPEAIAAAADVLTHALDHPLLQVDPSDA
ncbi:MAG: molecular chaperone HscC [Deltaproteobacteria bacterium]|nr:MAG: molecular chaperone HscC [Deltaproteobacteria bacterium]